jgi:uncharacterized pyridoxamine 5'-phosphate oxidase family protein
MSGNKEELFIKSIRDNFYILSAKNGKFIKNIKTNNESDTTLSEIIEWNNNVLFGSQNGNIYIIDKYYKLKALLLLEKNPVRNIYQVKENIFAASNLDGRIVVFKIANL